MAGPFFNLVREFPEPRDPALPPCPVLPAWLLPAACPPALPCPPRPYAALAPCFALLCGALPCPAVPCPALPAPALPRPACQLKRERSPCLPCIRATLTGCERRIFCWEPLLLVKRPAQAARTHNPTRIHLSSGCCETHIFCRAANVKQKGRNPPLRGVWGVNPKP